MTAKQHETARTASLTARELVARRQAEANARASARMEAATQTKTSTTDKTAATVPAVRTATSVVAPDTRPYRDRYLDEVSPASVVGRMIKFSKDGTFITTDDDQRVPESAEFIALCDETLIGWVKFNGVGEPPDRVMGLLYDGFVMPPRESLGDLDESQWSEGLDGKPADPWQHHQYLVLQDTATRELFTFVTSSVTGRRAVGNLLRHFNRTQKTAPEELPVVRLRTGGFQHKDSRVGFVTTPVFVVCGRQPRDSAAKPDTSTGSLIDDALPF
jgi:hypothetical protein